MYTPKKNFTIEQHHELGKELYAMSQRLMYLGNSLHGSYNKKTAELVFDVHDCLVKLRAEMDKHVSRETDDESGVYFKIKHITNSK